MKKILYLLLFLPVLAQAQTISVTPQWRGLNPQVNTMDSLQYNYSGKTGGASWLYNAEKIRSLFPTTTNTSFTVATIANLISYSGTATVVTVKEKGRGGTFVYITSGLTSDYGIVFPATGKGSGYWQRTGNLAVADAGWYGVSVDSLNSNATNINRAINGGYVSHLSIGRSQSDIITIEQPIYISGLSNLTVSIYGILKRPAETTYPLTATLAPNGTTVFTANANTNFKIGDIVGIQASNMPVQGQDAGINWKAYNTGRITSLNSTSLTIDSAARYGASIDSSSVVFRCHSTIIILNSTNINIQGGNLDGNISNAVFGYAQTKLTESFYSEAGVAILGSTNIQVSDIKISNYMLEGIKIAKNSNTVRIVNSYLENFNSKGIIAHYGWQNINISNIDVVNSNYEDGINFNGTTGYIARNLNINNIRTRLNGRFGTRIQAAIQGVNVSNVQSIMDGIGMQAELSLPYANISNVFIENPQDYRYNAGTQDNGALNIQGTSMNISNIIFNGVGKLAYFINLKETANINFNNIQYNNMNDSTGRAAIRGISASITCGFTNVRYTNVSATKVYMGNGATYFGDNTANTTFVMMDRPNFAVNSINRNRFGNYTASTGIDISEPGAVSISATQTTNFTFSGTNGHTGVETFGSNIASPLYVERTAGSAVAFRFSRPTNSVRADFLLDAADGFAQRMYNASAVLTGTVYSVPTGSTQSTFTLSPIMSDLTASLPMFTDANKKPTSTGTVPVSRGGTGSGTVLVIGQVPVATSTTVYTPTTPTGTGTPVFSASPTFTGVPAAPTASLGTNTTQIATTAFVAASVTAGAIPAGSTTQVQYNNSGAFGATNNFVWDNTNRILNIGNSTSSTNGGIIVGGSGTGIGTITGGGGSLVIVGGDLSLESNPTHRIAVKTNTIERLGIENDGTWKLAGSAGTSGQVLTTNGTGALPTWTTIPSMADNQLTKTADYTIVSGDFAAGKKTTLDLYVDCTAGNVTITLPTYTSFAGYTIYITKTDLSVNLVTINTVVGNNTLVSQYQSRQFNSAPSIGWINH